MAAVSHQVRPGLRFQPQDFYYGDELDEAVLRTITEESESLYEDSSSDELDDETALAIAIQESLESAKREDFRRSLHQQPVTARPSPLYAENGSAVSSSLLTSMSSSPSYSSRPQLGARPLSTLTVDTDIPFTPPLRTTTSSSPSTSASTHTSLSGYPPSSPSFDNPPPIHRPSTNRTAGSSSRTSQHLDVDEMAKLSRRSSMAAATRMLRSTLSRRSSRIAMHGPASSTLPPQSSDLQAEMKEYERLFFPKQLPACSRCGGRCRILSSVQSQKHRHSASSTPFKLHQHLHLICTVPECGQVYCRGCFKPRHRTNCPSHCFSSSGNETCPAAMSCCDVARLIGVFEVLKHLEETYLAVASSFSTSSPPSQRAGSQSGQWEDRAERTFALLRSLLSLDDDSSEDQAEFWSDIAPLLEVSLLRHVLSVLLRNASVKNWVAHSDMYLSVLALLRTLTDSPEDRVVALFMDPPGASLGSSRDHSGSSQYGGLRPDYGISRWARDCTEAPSPPSSNDMYSRLAGSSLSHSPSHDKGHRSWPLPRDQTQDSESLYSIIEGLDAHRMALIDMRNRINFPPTVEKLWAMADGLMYLVLQGLLL
ncbi:hypothetical protein D9758_013943 [Tetrapyrgos nigripes]|uniref:Uncharacterized protein n=1 Tax=Tetrapyrgos nigripes TaxID=182062 RepID=A0A8H5CIM3_9AGAR|nr:hypothetical protein D9758_013943 [Tetrapyrgos nigripes]